MDRLTSARMFFYASAPVRMRVPGPVGQPRRAKGGQPRRSPLGQEWAIMCG